jgi:hypothetical protein
MPRYQRRRWKVPEKPAATVSTLRIGVRLLGVVLLGTSPTHAAFAKEPAFRAHHINRSGQVVAGQSALQPPSGHPDGQSRPPIDRSDAAWFE